MCVAEVRPRRQLLGNLLGGMLDTRRFVEAQVTWNNSSRTRKTASGVAPHVCLVSPACCRERGRAQFSGRETPRAEVHLQASRGNEAGRLELGGPYSIRCRVNVQLGTARLHQAQGLMKARERKRRRRIRNKGGSVTFWPLTFLYRRSAGWLDNNQ